MRAAQGRLPAAAALALSWMFSLSSWATEAPRFVEEAGVAGIDHAYEGGWEHFVGGGVAVFDCNGDGFSDLYFAGGTAAASLYVNRSFVGGTLAFDRLPDTPLAVTAVSGAYPLDIDGDGHMDLVVLRVGENLVFRGRGNCRFERANEAWGFDGGGDWSTAMSAIWERDSDWPTLAIGNYVDRNQPGSPFGTCHDNLLLRPRSAGNGFDAPMPLQPGYCTLSMLFSDWNRDSVPDLRISNDRQYYRSGEEQLFLVEPGKPPKAYGRQDGWRSVKIWGMGIASHDLNRDGYPEYFLTSMTDNKLQILADGAGRPAYEDVAYNRGATAHRPFVGNDVLPSTAWHDEFGDVNNDGVTDLFIAKGNVEGMLDFAAKDPNNLLIGQVDGTFVEGAEVAGIVSFHRARGAAIVDLNLDGMLDIVVVNRKTNAELYRNIGFGERPDGGTVPLGNWLAIKLEQPGGNRNGVGSWIEVRAGAFIWRKEVTVGGGHAGGQAGWVHFGIGTAERALVRVQWPDGTWGPWVRTPADRFLAVVRDSERPLFWAPPVPVAGPVAGGPLLLP